jgi:hypothetical protein
MNTREKYEVLTVVEMKMFISWFIIDGSPQAQL